MLFDNTEGRFLSLSHLGSPTLATQTEKILSIYFSKAGGWGRSQINNQSSTRNNQKQQSKINSTQAEEQSNKQKSRNLNNRNKANKKSSWFYEKIGEK